ncbi:MAG: DUF4836 family protein [Chitinophagaceae bacterium]
MKLSLKSLPLIFTSMLLIIFSSCSKKTNVPVPQDAFFVLHVDGASLNAKLSWDEIKQSEWFKKAKEEVKDELAKTILDNPEESGINIKSDAYIFMSARGKGGYAAVTCNLTDEKKFEAFVTKVSNGKKAEIIDGITVLADNDNIITWKGNRLVFIADNPDVNPSAGGFGGEIERSNFETDSLVIFAKEIYNLKSSKSLGNNSKFNSLLKEKGDAHIWVNSGSLYSKSMPAMLALTKANLLFDGNISTAAFSFENGKIVIKGKNYFNKELAAIFKKYSKRNLDEEMLKMIPAGDVAAVIAMNYPPEAIKEIISLLGVDGLLNMFLAEAGFSIGDFVKANKGDVLFAVSDFKIANKEIKVPISGDKENTYKKEVTEAKLLFAISVGDKPAFEKLMNILKDKIGKETGEAGEIINKTPYQLKDKWFIAGNDSATVNGFGTTTTDHPFINLIKGHPAGGYVDIQKFINGARPSIDKDSTASLIANESLKYWQDIVFYGGEFKNNGIESFVEINMVDKNTNSLKQLNNYFGFIALKMIDLEKKKKEEYKKWDNQNDSVVVKPEVIKPKVIKKKIK